MVYENKECVVILHKVLLLLKKIYKPYYYSLWIVQDLPNIFKLVKIHQILEEFLKRLYTVVM